MRRFLVVTNNDLRLPLADCKNLREVSEYLGLSLQYVRKLNCGAKAYPRKATYRIESYDDGVQKAERHRMYQKKYDMTHDRSEYFRKRYKLKKINQEYEELLELKYIDNLSWKEVGKRMGFAQDTVKKKHGKALPAFNIPEGQDGT